MQSIYLLFFNKIFYIIIINYIIDPINGNHVSLFSPQGKSLLKQYVKLYQKGGASPPQLPPPECASYTSSTLKYERKFQLNDVFKDNKFPE